MPNYLTGHMKRLLDKTRIHRIVIHDASADPPKPRYVYRGWIEYGGQMMIPLLALNSIPANRFTDETEIFVETVSIRLSYVETSSRKSYNMPLAFISPDDLAKLDQRPEEALPSCLQRIR